jgi:hypothetical protein
MKSKSSDGKGIKEARMQLNLEYKKLIIGVMSKFRELGVTINNPDTVMNPLRLSLMALEKNYYKELININHHTHH